MYKKLYVIKRLKGITEPDNKMFDAGQPACINSFPWDKNEYRPRSEAKVLYNDLGLYVMLKSYETKIKAAYRNMNDPVYKDSCLEFFLNPAPDSGNKYLNFEVNPLGAMLLGYGPDRNHRELLPEEQTGMFRIRHSIAGADPANYKGPFWSVEFFIPFRFLKEYCGFENRDRNGRMTGNFYKCGDETAFPHFGCWNPVISPFPDFHRPECFGDLLLE